MARLAAFDMDGTLLMPDHHLGEKTLSTLARLRERDITLTFATGRHALEMQHILGALSLDAYLITGNGTRVHSLEGELLHRDDLPADVAELVLYQQWDTRASMHIFNDDGWFTGKEIPALLQAFVYSGFRYQIIDVKKMPLGSVTKICFCGDHDDLTRLQIQLYEALGERAHLCFSATDCLEVLPVGCNKGAALTVLTQHLGLSLRDCMAFGDAMNDREMLGSVGSGFIMGNAMPQLRAELPHLPVIDLLEEPEIRLLERVVQGPTGKLARFFNAANPNPADVRGLLATTRHWYAFFSLWTAYLERQGWNQSVDLCAWHTALEMGKSVIGMESLEEQVASLESVPLGRVTAFFRGCRSWKGYARRNIHSYLDGDLEGMLGTSTEFPSRTEQIIDGRNQRFRERMRPFLEEGRAAVFVGSAHMLQLRDMLAEDGFTVRQAYPTWRHRLRAAIRGRNGG